MNEQAPKGDLGGEVVVEVWQGLDRAAIEALGDEQGYGASVEIGKVDGDSDHYKEEVQRIGQELNDLLSMFGVSPADWQQNVLKLTCHNKSPREMFKEDIQRLTAGKSIGDALQHWGFYDLRIEDEEDGIGGVDLELALTDNLLVRIETSGDHWSGNHYKDPDTGKELVDAFDGERIRELEDRGEDMHGEHHIEYEVGFSLRYTAFFGHPDKS